MTTRRQIMAMAAAAGSAAAQSAGKKIRLAVVGGGFGTSFYFHEHPQCEVTAVTDLYAERRQRLRDTYRCDNVYESLEEMLKRRRDLDAVAIFSDVPSHVKHAKMCMEQGLHVISAVPACMSLEEAEELRAVEGEDWTSLHDGGDQLLSSDLHSCARALSEGRVRPDPLQRGRVLSRLQFRGAD